VWQKEVFDYESHLMGTSFIIIYDQYIKTHSSCVVGNVYSPYSLNGEKTLWEDLSKAKMASHEPTWCFCGDFKAVRNRSERKGINGRGEQTSELIGFNSFIDSIFLLELPLVGKKFMWFKPDGTTKSRIDRVLVNEDWLQLIELIGFNSFIHSIFLLELPLVGKRFMWFKPDGTTKSRIDRVLVNEDWLQLCPMSKQYVLQREVSDHCALVVKSVEKDWGPKPFRTIDAWFLDKGFSRMVQDKWQSYSVQGNDMMKIKEKAQTPQIISEVLKQGCFW